MRRERSSHVAIIIAAVGLLLSAGSALAQEPPLVELGQASGGSAAFALAPAGWRDFLRDAVFIVGQSAAAADWPYVHPGPDDSWAGRRQHIYRIVVDLASVPPAVDGELAVEMLDTHSNQPPEIEFGVNGTAISRESLPRGGGDGSLNGRAGNARRYAVRVRIPAGALKAGRNVVTITSLRGSWFIYEHVALRLAGASVAPVSNATFVVGARPVTAVLERDGRLWQPLTLDIVRAGARRPMTVRVDGNEVLRTDAQPGRQQVEVLIPAADSPRQAALEVDGQALAVSVRPVPQLTIYVVPHSHTDIGYTHLQPEVEQRQVENLMKGMAIAEKTAGYPEGARFVWNVEVLWAADLFLQRMEAPRRAAFDKAVKSGQVGLNGLYLNVLSGLARPEELVQSARFATQLSERLGVKIDTAMISDIPGHTWGLVPALAQAGIRYLSTSPNFFDRIGTTQVASADQPFWWIGPSGRDKVLTWNTWMGYALSHTWNAKLTDAHVAEYLDHLEQVRYPYDITYIRWSGLGDNSEPEPGICEFVKDWNARYRWPRFVISDQHAPFAALEERYSDRIPTRRGDWTPYWEDGAGSSSRETAMNRASADRMTQAETVWALRAPEAWPAAAADAAWKKVLLYTEHTWGAWNSISQPEERFVKDQWDIKRGYAEEADWLSRKLLASASPATDFASTFDVVNTLSWARTDVVHVPASLSVGGDRVIDAAGVAVPSQRLSTGELAVLVKEIPPFAARRYRVVRGLAEPPAGTGARATAPVLSNGATTVRLDPATGAVVELKSNAVAGNLVDIASGQAMNQYLFMVGSDAAKATTNGTARVTVKEAGPLVASLVAESDAPGAVRLSREVVLTAGLDRVALSTTVDKKRAPAGPKGDYSQPASKESVNLAFPFNVPGGEVRLELPLGGVIRPNVDQIDGSCKNWFVVGNWADVSADGRGVTWVTLDTPLVQLGGLTANLLNSQTDPKVWRENVEPTQKLYPWLMNNHWGTNYRAYQEGPVTFRFALGPHAAYDPAAATRLATGLSQPLLALPASPVVPSGRSRLTLTNDRVVATAFKPSDDGKGWVLRLYNVSDKEQQVGMEWADPKPARIFLSGTSEARGAEVSGALTIPAWGMVTIRTER
jgi:alpha-mannosidase